MRPQGELVVSIYRPMNYFGVGISFGVLTGGDQYLAVVRDSKMEWVQTDLGTVSEPTLLLGEDEVEVLRRELNNLPTRSGPQVSEHLADAIKVRDRLLALVERLWDT